MAPLHNQQWPFDITVNNLKIFKQFNLNLNKGTARCKYSCVELSEEKQRIDREEKGFFVTTTDKIMKRRCEVTPGRDKHLSRLERRHEAGGRLAASEFRLWAPGQTDNRSAKHASDQMAAWRRKDWKKEKGSSWHINKEGKGNCTLWRLKCCQCDT